MSGMAAVEGFGGHGAGVCDATGRLVLVSRDYASLLNRSVEDLLAIRWQDVVHPDDLPLCDKDYQILLREGRSYDVTCRILQPDRAVVWASFRAWRVLDSTGRPFVQFTASWKSGARPAPRSSDIEILRDIEEMAARMAAIAEARDLDIVRYVLAIASEIAHEERCRLLDLSNEQD